MSCCYTSGRVPAELKTESVSRLLDRAQNSLALHFITPKEKIQVIIFKKKIPYVVNLKNAVEGENASAGGRPVRLDRVHKYALLVNSV